MVEWPVKLDLSVKVSEETTDKIAGALLDLISPITQPAGLLGQYVKQRRKSLSTVFKIGLEKARQGEKEIKAPPPKFLLEFADKASREDVESELIEMWANLLAQASTDYESSLITFCDIISRLGKSEAEALRVIAQGVKGMPQSGVSPLTLSEEAFLNKLEFQIANLLTAPAADEMGQLFDEILKVAEQSKGREVLFCYMPESFDIASPHPLFERVPGRSLCAASIHVEFSLSLSILQREGLITIRETNFYSKFDVNKSNPFAIGYSELTILGLGFVEICDRPRSRAKEA